MAQTCLYCCKVFHSSKVLDKHGAPCLKKEKMPITNLHSQHTEGSSLHVQKRARVESPDMGNDGSHKEPPLTRSVRSGHTVYMPCRLLDYVPHRDMSLAHVPPCAPTSPEHNDCSVTPMVDDEPTADERPHPLQTVPNKLSALNNTLTHHRGTQKTKRDWIWYVICSQY